VFFRAATVREPVGLIQIKMKLRILALTFAATIAATAGSPTTSVTYYKDVAPVLQNRCQQCHRPGEVAPMSFTSYNEVRPWAKAIKAAVVSKKMPPWFADPHFGKFSNDRALSQDEMNTLVAWTDSGAKEGNPKDAPRPREWVEGWEIGKPDQVLQMPVAVDIPSSGVVEYMYVVIPTNFTEDKWIQAAEARPEARTAMHHVIAFIRPPGSSWMIDAQPGVPFIPGRQRAQVNAQDQTPGELLVGYAPGLPPTECKPGEAKLMKAGADIVLQLHYTPNGKAASDRSKIGLIFAKKPPQRRVMTMNAMNFFLNIPAGDPNYEAHSRATMIEDVELVSMMPHMHLRGKDFLYKAVYPTGETQTLLSVPHYDFNWQLSYVLTDALLLPKGTRIECTAHFDNSPNNAANPDPTKVVKWGDQTWEEMMIGWFDVSMDAKADPATLRQRPGRSE
jgi:mono/diheme cytochrome c family protein